MDLYRTSRRLVLDPPGGRVLRTVPRTLGFVASSYFRGRRVPVWPEPPAARPTPGLAAQVAMDELVLAVMASPKRYPHRVDYERVGAEVLAAVELYERRGWLDDPRSFHRDLPAPTAGEVRLAWRRARRMPYQHLSFESGYEPWEGEPGIDRWAVYEANKTAHAWVLRHDDNRPRPWLVCVHGFGMGSAFMDFSAFRAARLHREHGLNLVFTVLPLHGPRQPNRLGGFEFMSFDALNTVHGVAQAISDIRRTIGWVRAEHGAGATAPIGVYGISLGGFMAALLSSIEPGLDLVISGIPPTDLPALFAHHAPPVLRRRAVANNLLGEQVHRLHRVVSPLAMPSLVPKERRFLYAGHGDRMSTPKQAYRLWEHWDHPEMAWYSGNHVGFMWSKDAERFVTASLRSTGFDAGET